MIVIKRCLTYTPACFYYNITNGIIFMYARTKQAEQNAFLESCLAIYFARRPGLFPIVNTFSNKILAILADHEKRTEILKQLEIGDNFKNLKNELYVIADHEKNFFRGPLGALKPNKPIDEISPEDALCDIEMALKKDNANLINIMPIHSVFGYRILRLLNPNAYNQAGLNFAPCKKSLEVYKKLVTKKAEDKDIPVTKQLGVAITDSLCQKINAMEETQKLNHEIDVLEHRNSFGRFAINNETGKFNQFISCDVPLAAGPSTHALSLFTAAYAYKDVVSIELTNEALQEYALAYFTYLTTAGYHTFHEVMFSANLSLGLTHDMHSYLNNIPKENIQLFTEFNTVIELLSAERYSPMLFNNKKTLNQVEDNQLVIEKENGKSSSLNL